MEISEIVFNSNKVIYIWFFSFPSKLEGCCLKIQKFKKFKKIQKIQKNQKNQTKSKD